MRYLVSLTIWRDWIDVKRLRLAVWRGRRMLESRRSKVKRRGGENRGGVVCLTPGDCDESPRVPMGAMLPGLWKSGAGASLISLIRDERTGCAQPNRIVIEAGSCPS